MKDPKDMTREELADALVQSVNVSLMAINPAKFANAIREAATRLRNSIDRPKVEVVQTLNGGLLKVNGHPIMQTGDTVYDTFSRLRTALGMEGV